MNGVQELLADGALEGDLSSLATEPRKLRVEISHLEAEIRDFSLRNYGYFLVSEKSRRHIKHQLQQVSASSDRLVGLCKPLKEACERFAVEGGAVCESHRKTRQTLHYHLQILELLEIPQIMDTCVRNDLYDEALDLSAFVSNLERRHRVAPTESGNVKAMKLNPIIASIVTEVHDSVTLMRDRLLAQLRTNLQLPTCLRIVSYLRRLDAQMLETSTLSSSLPATVSSSIGVNHTLKAQFLSNREAWLTSAVESLPPAEPYQFLMSIIEKKRTTWFDLITQYKAIFGSEEIKGRQDDLLASWAVRNVELFLRQIEEYLAQITDGGQICNVMEQSFFFAASLSRVGADFRVLLIPIVERRIITIVQEGLIGALHDFEEAISVMTTHSGKKGESGGELLTLIVPSLLGTDFSTGDSVIQKFAPPRSLMTCPALASFTNSVLTALNELRRMALLSVCNPLALCFQDTLQDVVISLSSLASALQVDLASTSPAEPSDAHRSARAQVLMAGRLFGADLVPYLIKCFVEVFDGHEPVQHLLSEMAILKELDSRKLYTSEKLKMAVGREFDIRALQKFRTHRKRSLSPRRRLPLSPRHDSERGSINTANIGERKDQSA